MSCFQFLNWAELSNVISKQETRAKGFRKHIIIVSADFLGKNLPGRTSFGDPDGMKVVFYCRKATAIGRLGAGLEALFQQHPAFLSVLVLIRWTQEPCQLIEQRLAKGMIFGGFLILQMDYWSLS